MPDILLLPRNTIPVGTIYCIGRNYLDHIRELENEPNTEPVLFLKPSAALVREGMPIELPSFSCDVHHEAELVLLIGQEGRHVTEEHATDVIAGVGVGLDLTARDKQSELRAKGLPWTIAKGFETSACVSSFVPPSNLPPLNDLNFSLHVNGELRQSGHTSLMIFSVQRIISFISGLVRLLPGDLIFTGTPKGVAGIHEGDTLELSLEDALHANFRVGVR